MYDTKYLFNSLCFLFLFLILSVSVFSTNILTEDFEGYSIGAINGQGDWLSDEYVAVGRSNGVYLLNNSNLSQTIKRFVHE